MEELCAEAAFCPGLSPFCRHSLCGLRAALGRLSLPQTRLDREIAGGSVRRRCLSCWGAEWPGDQQVPPLLELFPAWGSGGRASCPQGPLQPFQGGLPGAGAGLVARELRLLSAVETSWEMLQPPLHPTRPPPECPAEKTSPSQEILSAQLPGPTQVTPHLPRPRQCPPPSLPVLCPPH